MHVSLKALKQLTSLGALERSAGLNFTPGVVMAIAAVFCIAMKRGKWELYGVARPGRMPANAVLLALYLVPLIGFLAWHTGGPVTGAFAYFGLVAFTAVGEELFFRGYIQSRLNGVFGRPWHISSIPVGAGLFLSAILFGFLHALNTVDYFRGHFVFAWSWALATTATGTLLGMIREKTGSLIPGMIAHGLLDVWIVFFLMLLRR